jgi:hypothetical protein
MGHGTQKNAPPEAAQRGDLEFLQSGRCLDPADPSKPQASISFLFGLPFCRRTKDGGTLRTVLDARAYMLRLSRKGSEAPNGKGRPN